MAEWILNGASVALNSPRATAPNNTNTALLLSRGADAAYIHRDNEITCEAATPYSFTVFAKPDTESLDTEFLVIRLGGDLSQDYVEVSYDLEDIFIGNGPIVVGNNIIRPLAHIENIGDGWYACQVSWLCTTSISLDIGLTSRVGGHSLTTADSASSGVFIWNPLLEQRYINDDPSYLGSGVFNIIPSVTRGFTYIPVLRSTTHSVEYEDNLNNSRSIVVSNQGENFNTSNAVSYVRFPQDALHGFPDTFSINNNRGNERLFNINRQDIYEKRQPVRITFVNKQGVLEDLWAIRRSTDHLEVNNDTYYKNVIDYGSLRYNTRDHTRTKYNVVGRKTIVVNTDLIPEEENCFFEELFLSEQVWITRDGVTTPVLLQDKQFTYKTHVNDTLVQYELTFKFSNRVDNTIR